MQAMLVRRLTEPPPSARTVRPNVPEGVDQAIRRALAPVPADRFATMAQFGAALVGRRPRRPCRWLLPRAGRRAGGRASGRWVSRRPCRPRRASGGSPSPRPRLLLGLLIGGGALFAWRRSHQDGAASDGNERRIAVLPFQNLGDSADAYFADGITDAVRGKLTALPSMRVIGSNSSAQYRGTSKTPREIGRELGVDYLLVGKVRWQKGASGAASRVQVSPELIDVSTADAKWQQPFDASITDVFQVQADIAGRVAQALDVAIGSRQQRVLENRPTRNLAAYDAFLKGQAQRALGNGAGPAPRGHPVLRAGGGTRFELRGGVGGAVERQLVPVQQRHAIAGGGGPVALRRRAGAGVGSAEYRGVRRAGELPPVGHQQRRAGRRAVHQGSRPRAE